MPNRVKILFLIALCGLVSGFVFVGKETARPAGVQPDISSLVATFLSYYHYERLDINDDISARLLDEYIESLDYNRMFFLASDIEEFQEFRFSLDNDLHADPVNLEKPYAIFKRYKQRTEERVKVILNLLKRDFDYTSDETYPLDRKDAPWAASKAELDELWRLRLKEELVRFKLREKPRKEGVELLEKRYERLRKSLDEFEEMDILEGYLSTLATSFDPHSSYMKPASKENFDIEMGHSLEGIGATLRREGEYTIIVDLVEGGPAERSGQIQPNDKIIAVAQADGIAHDVVDMRLDKVVKQIRGKKGSTVHLTLIPAEAADQAATKEVTLIRDRVEITANDAKSEIKEIKDEGGQTHRLGVIEIPSFYLDSQSKYRGNPDYKSTTRDVRRLIDDLKKEHIDGLVIDLRQNGGGSLDEAIQLTGLFIDSGPVVQIRDFKGGVDIETDPDPAQAYGGPLLVLTSIFSASASEIFASAIQDYDRGIVVGSRSTHGKGTVQNLVPLQNALSKKVHRFFEEDVAGALKITTHKFYRISGGSTQFKGVEPDIVLPSPFDGLEITEEALDYALPWDEIDAVPHKDYGLVRQALPFLKNNSAQRIAKDPEFRYVREDVAEREKQKQENAISLNFEKRLKEKEALEARQKARDEERKLRLTASEREKKPSDGEKEVLIPDFAMDEALMILGDYISFQNQRVAGIDIKKDAL